MLPRISAALSQFLAPISVSGGNTPDLSSQKGQPQSKQEEKQEEPPAQPDLKLISADIPPDAPPERQNEQTSTDEAEASEKARTLRLRLRNQIGNSAALIQFFRAMSTGSEKVGRIFAFRSYQKATSGQKKGSKFKKGAMLDQKAS